MLRGMKLPGIGQINAFALLAIIGDVRRYENPSKLVAYIGLNPGQRESGRGKHIKLQKLAVALGKEVRGELALPPSLTDCMKHLREQIDSPTAAPPQKSPA